jgi:hypothetical protein
MLIPVIHYSKGKLPVPFPKPNTLPQHCKQLLIAKFNSLVCPGSLTIETAKTSLRLTLNSDQMPL